MLEEKDKQLARLDAEIAVLRIHGPAPFRFPVPTNPSGLPDKGAAEQTDGGWVSEADEAEAIIEKAGLSAIHLSEILDGLGYGNSDLS